MFAIRPVLFDQKILDSSDSRDHGQILILPITTADVDVVSIPYLLG